MNETPAHYYDADNLNQPTVNGFFKNKLTWQDNCGGSNRGGWDVQLLHDVLGPRQGHHPAEHLFHKVTKANQLYWLKLTFVPGVHQPGPGEALVFWASGQTSVISLIWRLPSYKGLDKRSLYSVHSGYLENHSVHLSATKPLGIKVIEKKWSLVKCSSGAITVTWIPYK